MVQRLANLMWQGLCCRVPLDLGGSTLRVLTAETPAIEGNWAESIARPSRVHSSAAAAGGAGSVPSAEAAPDSL